MYAPKYYQYQESNDRRKFIALEVGAVFTGLLAAGIAFWFYQSVTSSNPKPIVRPTPKPTPTIFVAPTPTIYKAHLTT